MNTEILHQTQSVCPVCLKVIAARYVAHADDSVHLEKTCPEHGFFTVPIWQNKDHFLAWQRENPTQKPIGAIKPVEKGCPYDCGLCTAHIQASCCVLLEVTSRCNLSCPTCYASAGVPSTPDPSFQTVVSWFDRLMQKGGPFNIQLSGGEPTLRDDLPDIIQAGKEKGFTFFQLNTNGLRLAQDSGYLQALKDAGLSTVFLQFDSLKDKANQQLRGASFIQAKKEAIQNCKQIGIGVVLVPTVQAHYNLDDMGDLVQFAKDNMPTVRGVHFQPISYFGRCDEEMNQDRVNVLMLLNALQEQTGGRVQASHFSPASAEHAMCSFHAEYVIKGDTWIPKKQAGTLCCSTPSSTRARQAVALKWSLELTPSADTCIPTANAYDFSALDDFLNERYNHTLALSGMAFQDAWTLDLQRLKRCHVHIVSQKGELIPFCAMNLTAQDGTSLHRL